MDFETMTDDELNAMIADAVTERERRAAIPEDERPDQGIQKLLRERHERLYGKANPRAEQIAEQHHRNHWGGR